MIPLNIMSSISLKIKEKVLNFLKKYNLTDKNQIIFVGFSGGVDSTCLLDVLFKLSQEYGFKLVAGHLNHNWRGEESKKEAFQAKQFCFDRNIEFYSEILPEGLPKTEEEARKQRYEFFNRISARIKSTAILTGHTLSDQIETVLYRLIKGTGISGLKGIPEMRLQENFPVIYRPLLEITREETTEYCKENNIEPNIDSSNFEEKYLRNRIRLSLIPELKTYNPEVESAVLRLSSVAKDYEEIIEEYLYKGDNNYGCPYKTQEFLKLSEALQRKILYDFLIKNNLDFNYEKVKSILTFIKESSSLKSGNTLSVGKNAWLFASSSEIIIINSIKAEESLIIMPFNPEGETNFHSLGLLVKSSVWKGQAPKKFPKETELKAYIDLSSVKTPLFLRTRRAGDIIQPFGMKEKTKLKKYLINKGIPEFERDKLLLLANEEEVLWVVGVGMSELLRVNNIPTHEIEIKNKNKP